MPFFLAVTWFTSSSLLYHNKLNNCLFGREIILNNNPNDYSQTFIFEDENSCDGCNVVEKSSCFCDMMSRLLLVPEQKWISSKWDTLGFTLVVTTVLVVLHLIIICWPFLSLSMLQEIRASQIKVHHRFGVPKSYVSFCMQLSFFPRPASHF